ncbi:FG-GAP repeat domain-containing protein [Actinokineospora cianjurensis]|uniref:FG-GAP repeat domain-containing protein n=1 Tax=Actinokineospora cianjurensis TaxID=585224 RepID=UPI000EB57ED2|nr:VCBS repeat-containing protein [Actinokineospora cianjurensis]
MPALRKLALVALAALAPLLVPVDAAAGGRAQPVIGDVTGDGLADRVTFQEAWDNYCDVLVEPGQSGGGYGSATYHRYESPVVYAPYCPDMGEIVDLGGDGTKEIVATNFWGEEYSLVALRPNGYAADVLGTYQGVNYPKFIRQVDFTGDGRQDVWLYSDQSFRLRSFDNTAAGGLVPGSIDVCSDGLPQHVFADFDGDGGQDMLAALNCGNRSASLLFGGGKPARSLGSVSGPGPSFVVALADHNGDQYPDLTVRVPQPDYTLVTERYVNDGTGGLTLLP